MLDRLPRHALTSLSHLISTAAIAMMCINLLNLKQYDITILTFVIFIAAVHAQLRYMCLITHDFGRGSFGYVGLQSGSLNKKGCKPLLQVNEMRLSPPVFMRLTWK